MTPRTRRFLQAFLLLLLAVAVPSLAQPPPESSAQPSSESPAPVFGEILDVRVVNLEVVVTRGKERVSGLQASEFALYVDGAEVPIEYFTEVSGGLALPPAAGAVQVPSVQAGSPVGRRFLVFIDDFFAIPSYRNRVLKDLLDDLPRLGTADRMAVVAYDGRRLELLSSWTRSERQLRQALEAAQKRPSHGLRWIVTPSRAGRLSRSSFSEIGFAGRRSAGSELDLLETRQRVSRVVRAAASSLRGFARPPGRKVMLLLSGGWPISPWTGAERSADAAGNRRVLQPLIDTANRLGYTLYPVDVPGHDRVVGADTPRGGARRGVFGRSTGEGEDALIYLAEETGGEALIDGGSFAALRRAEEDSQSYYWLGFVPPWQGNDEVHQVEVRLRRPELKARARRSYSDLSRRSEIGLWMESAQLFDLPPSEAMSLDVGLEPAAGRGSWKLRVRLPRRSVTVLPSADGLAADLELRIAAIDSDGRASEVPAIPMQFRDIDPDARMLVFDTDIRLRRQRQVLWVSVFDPPSGELMAARLPFDP